MPQFIFPWEKLATFLSQHYHLERLVASVINPDVEALNIPEIEWRWKGEPNDIDKVQAEISSVMRAFSGNVEWDLIAYPRACVIRPKKVERFVRILVDDLTLKGISFPAFEALGKSASEMHRIYLIGAARSEFENRFPDFLHLATEDVPKLCDRIIRSMKE